MVVSNIFKFNPHLREMIPIDSYFSDGLKSPTSLSWICPSYIQSIYSVKVTPPNNEQVPEMHKQIIYWPTTFDFPPQN